jgi:hypothetical protein
VCVRERVFVCVCARTRSDQVKAVLGTWGGGLRTTNARRTTPGGSAYSRARAVARRTGRRRQALGVQAGTGAKHVLRGVGGEDSVQGEGGGAEAAWTAFVGGGRPTSARSNSCLCSAIMCNRCAARMPHAPVSGGVSRFRIVSMFTPLAPWLPPARTGTTGTRRWVGEGGGVGQQEPGPTPRQAAANAARLPQPS